MSISKRFKFCGSRTTKIINHHLLNRGDAEAIIETIRECLEKYNLDIETNYVIDSVEISKRLKTCAGRCDVRRSNGTMIFKIKLAHNNFMEFGFGSMIKTLRHEMAHLIEFYKYGKSNHSERFKLICVDLGGHMNRRIAGRAHAENATVDYCKSSYKYSYNCSCGAKFKRKRKITSPRSLRGRCRTCGEMVMNMRMEVL